MAKYIDESAVLQRALSPRISIAAAAREWTEA